MADLNQPGPSGSPEKSRWRAVVRRYARPLILAAFLLVVLAVVVTAGWTEGLASSSAQAWHWVRRHLLASPAMAVLVAALGVLVTALGVWVAWRTLSWQKGHAKKVAEQLARAEAERARIEALRAKERQAAWEQRCRLLLSLWPLPTIEDVNPYEIGVFYSRRAEVYRGDGPRPPYVTRAVDEELAGLLHAQQLILVKGQSRAGKSRTAFEVAARRVAGRGVPRPLLRQVTAAFSEMSMVGGRPAKAPQPPVPE